VGAADKHRTDRQHALGKEASNLNVGGGAARDGAVEEVVKGVDVGARTDVDWGGRG
jgi:hypothetical protein